MRRGESDDIVSAAEFREFKERVLEFHQDIKQKLSSIDTNISSLTPLISTHSERLNYIENASHHANKRIDRLEKFATGAITITLIGALSFIITNVLSHVFNGR